MRLVSSALALLLGCAGTHAELAGRVRAETLHAWRGYQRHAWGHDELKPLGKAPHDWYADTLLSPRC